MKDSIAELPKEEFLALFNKKHHESIIKLSQYKPGIEAVVCLGVEQMDSSSFGSVLAMVVGPGCRWTLDKVREEGFHLGDVPSRHYYPKAFWRPS